LIRSQCRTGPAGDRARVFDSLGGIPVRLSTLDGGAALDPETGFLYVASQTGLSTTEVGKDPCSEHRYTQAPHDSCGQVGAPAPPPGYVAPQRGRGAGGRGGRGGGPPVSYANAAPGTSNIAGISILKPRELGGITAYNMNTGDKAWWIGNGGTYTPTPQAASPDAKLFAGVTLLPQGGRGQAQVITTKSLVIYGTGRNGGAPGVDPTLYAVDKATGKQVGALPLPTKTSAVPMTFMHKGRQYIVYATGGGAQAFLVGLRLPR
jgi:quinoprotein glucose dehydrogenase